MSNLQFNEININEIESLEETNTPAFGVICGGGCGGIACFG